VPHSLVCPVRTNSDWTRSKRTAAKWNDTIQKKQRVNPLLSVDV
jgi:hypothetical protein